MSQNQNGRLIISKYPSLSNHFIFLQSTLYHSIFQLAFVTAHSTTEQFIKITLMLCLKQIKVGTKIHADTLLWTSTAVQHTHPLPPSGTVAQMKIRVSVQLSPKCSCCTACTQTPITSVFLIAACLEAAHLDLKMSCTTLPFQLYQSSLSHNSTTVSKNRAPF